MYVPGTSALGLLVKLITRMQGPSVHKQHATILLHFEFNLVLFLFNVVFKCAQSPDKSVDLGIRVGAAGGNGVKGALERGE